MGIDPMNNISIIIRILFAVTLFQHKLLSFKGYLQEKGSLAIDLEGSQDPIHSEE
jgi:hypothetical protein